MHVGSVVGGRFVLEALAGTGGMGAVYRAQDLERGTPAAVKLLHPHAYREAARFAREAEALALLSHPAIVRYLGHGTFDAGMPWLAMEWLEGQDLHARLERGPLPLDEALALVGRVAEALADAHQSGLVHRDIKPTNLFLVGGHVADVKLLDFGIVRWQSRAITRTDAVFGTPGYIAPEQAAGSSRADARADIFSLGCVLFEALTGCAAFQGDNAMAVLAKVLLQDAPPLSERMPDAPAPLQDLLARMLAKDPAQRPADGAALRAELSRLDLAAHAGIVAGERVAGRTITLGEQRIVSLVVAADPGANGSATAEALRAAVWPHAERLEVLVDGTVVVATDASGSPTDQAARAARCALAIQACLPGCAVAVVTGRGEITARNLIGATIDRATRMLDAGAGVRVDEDSAALLEGRFDLERETEHETEPERPAVRLVRERRSAEVPRTVLGRVTPCVGRDADLRAVLGCFEDCVRTGRSRAVLVTGPPGIGKTRLRSELLGAIRARWPDVEVWSGRGNPLAMATPFGMIAGALREVCGLADGSPDEVARERLLARAAACGDPATQRQVAELLGELVGKPFPDASDAVRAARNDPATMAPRLAGAVADLAAAQCTQHPLLLVLEDLHWADAPTVRLVDAVLRTLTGHPLVVLAMARPDVGERFPKLWQARRLVELALGELPPRAGLELVRSVLGADLPEARAQRLVDLSGGNPFYLEELIRAAAAGRDHDTTPPTVVGMVQARLGDLGAERRRWLRVASVFGETFWPAAVAALLGEGAPAPAEVLEDLLDRELVRPQPGTRYPGQPEYLFQHALVREAAYEMLTDHDRTLAHRLAAEWREAHGERDSAVLAEHLEVGGDLARAAKHWARAALDAYRGHDMEAVLGLVERANACGADGNARAELQLVLVRLHHWRVDLPSALAWADTALAAATPGTALWYDAIGIHAIASMHTPHRVDRVEALVPLLADVPTEQAAFLCWARACAHAAIHLALTSRLAATRTLRARLDANADRFRDDDLTLEVVLNFRAHHDRFEGDAAAFAMQMPAVVEVSEREGSVALVLVDTLNVVWGHVELGAYELAEGPARDLMEKAAAVGSAYALHGAQYMLGRALLGLGNPTDALLLLRAAADGYGNGGYHRFTSIAAIAVAEAHFALGDLEAATAEATRAVDSLGELPAFLSLARATRARAHLAAGRLAQAEADIGEAMAPLLHGGPPVEQPGRVRLVHAEVLHAAGQGAEAHAAIADARDELHARAARMDARWRTPFLENVADHVRTFELARAWLGER